MNRRDFLHPRELAHAAGQALAALQQPAVPPRPEIALLRFVRRAMATDFELFLPFGTPDALELAGDALDEIDRLENQLTVFHDSSEVSRLNRLAPTQPVVVEERLFGLLQRAAAIWRDTGGAFDVTTGALTRSWGFYRRQGRVPSEEERAEVMTRVGMQHVVLDAERRAVRFLRPVEINLGSIGKGYALDRAAEVLRTEHGLTAGLLHGGHSSVYAIGYPPGDERGWEVGVCHPNGRARGVSPSRLAVLRLRDRGLGTSAATFQHLEYNGRKLGHILDPRTGWPAEGVASATVTAPTAAEADALATAFFVLGAEAARDYCAAHPGIGALLLPHGSGARPILFGLAAEECILLNG
jgi:thiamine biosynthesis lipoprotein